MFKTNVSGPLLSPEDDVLAFKASLAWNSTFEAEKNKAEKAVRRARDEASRASDAFEEASRAKDQARRAESEKEQMKDQARRAELEKEQMKDQARRAELEKEQMKDQARRAESEKEQMEDQARRAELEKEQMKDQARRAESEKEQMKDQARRAESEKEQMEDQARRAEKEKEQMKDQARRAEMEREEERDRANDAEKKAERIKQEVEQKEQEEKNLKEQFRWGPKKALSSSDEECEKYRIKFQEERNTAKGHTMLLFGPTSHGKSSVGNGFKTAVEDKELPSTYHHVAQGEESVSRAFKTTSYALHRIIDMPGIFEGKAIKDEDIRKIVTGQVPWVSKVTATLETPDNLKAHNDTVECIIIVLRYDMTEIPPELKRQIGVIWSLCGEDVLSCHLVLTHLDVCDPQFKNSDNLPYIFKSAKVLKAVEKMSKATGIPPYNISFVKNYTTEKDTDVNSKLQYLRILNAVISSADEVVEARMTKARMTEEYRQQGESILDRVMTYYEFLFLIGAVLIAILIAYFSLF